MNVSEIFEVIMVVCFGISWPISIRKSIIAKTTKGKSILFIVLIDLGYICGIAKFLTADKISYVLIFYIINFVMVTIDIIIYFRNAKYDKKSGGL
jgi:hypothetical protein